MKPTQFYLFLSLSLSLVLYRSTAAPFDFGNGSSGSVDGTFQVKYESGKAKVLRPTELEMQSIVAKANAGDDASQMLLSEVSYALKNFAEGERWLKMAAKQGNIFAEYTLGSRLTAGHNGGPTNVDEGIIWLKLAAYEGYSGAQHELALYYAQGIGVKKDMQEAYSWLLISERSWPFPDESTTRRLVSFEKQLTPEQIQLAKTRPKNFVPTVVNRNALIDFGPWKLKAISESRGSPIAVINDQAFTVGEQKGVAEAFGRRLVFRCLEIGSNSVIVATEPYWQRGELRLSSP